MADKVGQIGKRLARRPISKRGQGRLSVRAPEQAREGEESGERVMPENADH